MESQQQRSTSKIFLLVSLIPLFVATKMLDQWLTDQTYASMNASEGGTGLLFFYGLLTFLSSAFLPVLAALILYRAWGFRLNTFNNVFNQLVKEQLRVYGSVINWSFLLIIPGLWKMLEYSLVPLIVIMDPEYEAGHRDALQESRKLFKRIWGRLLVITLFFVIILPLILTSLDGYRSFSGTPFYAMGLSLVDLAVFILFQWLLLKFWRQARGTDVQMARC